MRRSLPVRTLATGSECSKGGLANIGPGMILCFRWGLSVRRTQDWGCSSDRNLPLERSLPVGSVLRGSDSRSLLERPYINITNCFYFGFPRWGCIPNPNKRWLGCRILEGPAAGKPCPNPESHQRDRWLKANPVTCQRQLVSGTLSCPLVEIWDHALLKFIDQLQDEM